MLTTQNTQVNMTCAECGKPLTAALVEMRGTAQYDGFCDSSCQKRYLRMLAYRAKEAHKRAAKVATASVRRALVVDCGGRK